MATDERRVVTALFADIVGFTALSEHRDPEEVKRLVDRCFRQLAEDITSFGGVVDKVMGDEIIALFGAPTAHEDDAERAVRAALRMQETLCRISDDEIDSSAASPVIRMRIGVNTGEVLVGTSTAGGDYTAMGDVMNTASRLEQLAEPGQVLVGAATHQATAEAVRFESLGRLPAKGREEPLEAWIAVEALRPPGAHRKASERFVGRERELALLESQGTLAFDLYQSQLALVIGEAGMGKTRLVDEVAARLQHSYDAALWKGHCVPYGEANVWWPVAEVIRDLFALNLDAPQSDVEGQVAAQLAMRLDDPSPSGLDRTRTALMHALGFPSTLRGGDPTHNRSEVTQAVSQLLEVELLVRPVIIVISDIHWAGEAVWDLLDRLLNQWARHRLLILTTARAIERTSLFDGRHGTAIVQLGPLHIEAARELLASLQEPGQQPLPADTVDALVARSGGNPFFLEELASLVHDPTQTPRALGELSDLPNTLRGIVAARLDALAPGERALLEEASVLGRSGSLAGLRILAENTRGNKNADADLQGLIDKDLLTVDGKRFEFRSELVRDVAYGTLTKAARAERHRDIAHYLEHHQQGQLRHSVVVAIADHYRAAARLSTELMLLSDGERAALLAKALHWVELAGERALAAGEAAEAEEWFGSGLDMASDDRSRSDFLYGRARARCEVHDIAGARSDLERLDDLAAHDPLLGAKALLTTGDVSRKAGDLAEAARELREAADRLAALGATGDQALALRLLGLTEMARSDDSLARQAFEASRLVAAQSGDRRSEAWTLQSMAWLAFSQGRVHDANQLAAVAIEVFVELGDRSGLAWAQGVQAWVAFHLGQMATAEELVDSLLPTVRRRGDPWAEALMLNLAASLALWTGRAADAVNLSGEAVDVARRSDDQGLEVQALAVQGRSLVSLGRVTDGSAILERAFTLADHNRDRFNRRIAIIANCASAARIGEAERAIRWASYFDGFHDDLSVVGEADLIVSLALALLQRGAVDEAGSQLVWVEDTDSRRVDYYAEAVRAMIAAAEGRVDDVETSVTQILSGRSTYLDRVVALLAWAAARSQQADLVGCDQALAEARSIIDGTDDRLTRWVIDLVAGICGRGDRALAERQMANAGLDPEGLVTAWSLAARVPAEH